MCTIPSKIITSYISGLRYRRHVQVQVFTIYLEIVQLYIYILFRTSSMLCHLFWIFFKFQDMQNKEMLPGASTPHDARSIHFRIVRLLIRIKSIDTPSHLHNCYLAPITNWCWTFCEHSWSARQAMVRHDQIPTV